MPYLGFEPTFGEYPSQIFAGTATGPNGSKTAFHNDITLHRTAHQFW